MPALLPQAAVRGVKLLSLVVVLAENVLDVGRVAPQVDVVAAHFLDELGSRPHADAPGAASGRQARPCKGVANYDRLFGALGDTGASLREQGIRQLGKSWRAGWGGCRRTLPGWAARLCRRSIRSTFGQ